MRRSPGRLRFPALLATAAAALAAVVAVVAPADAHTVLRSSDPVEGASLAASPAQVALVFSEDVVALGTRAEVTVDGAAVAAAEPVVDGPRVVVPVEGSAPAGRYVVLWRVTSSDGHPISGELTFEVVAGGADDPAPASPEPGTASPAAPEVGGARDGSPSGWLLAGLGVGAMAVAGLSAGALRRSRRRRPAGHEGRSGRLG